MINNFDICIVFLRGLIMSLRDEIKSWDFNSKDPYLPIAYEGKIIGFCKANYAVRITKMLNEQESFRKALYKACHDLLALNGGKPEEIKKYVQKYLTTVKRPKYGIGAIKALLQDRQEELDLSDTEFMKFCDSYRLSNQEFQNIYKGKNMEDESLHSIARIVGISFDELLEVRYGFKNED